MTIRALLAAAACLLLSPGCGVAAPADGCTHTEVARAMSPDGAALAAVDEAVCEGGLSADITAQVTLQASGAPPVPMLGVDTGGHPEDRPVATWAGPKLLLVTVPNLSYLKVLRHRASGVSVQVLFNPPDPAARAAWLKRLGLAAE